MSAGLGLAPYPHGWAGERLEPQVIETARKINGSETICFRTLKKTNGFEVSGSTTSARPMILRGQHNRRLYRIPPVSESLKKAMKINSSEIDRSRRLTATSLELESSMAKHMKNIRNQ